MSLDRFLGFLGVSLGVVGVGTGVLGVYLALHALPEYTQNVRFCFRHGVSANCSYTMYQCQTAQYRLQHDFKISITQSCRRDNTTAVCYPGPGGKMLKYIEPPESYVEEDDFTACPDGGPS